jgi:hypothetical protein
MVLAGIHHQLLHSSHRHTPPYGLEFEAFPACIPGDHLVIRSQHGAQTSDPQRSLSAALCHFPKCRQVASGRGSKRKGAWQYAGRDGTVALFPFSSNALVSRPRKRQRHDVCAPAVRVGTGNFASPARKRWKDRRMTTPSAPGATLQVIECQDAQQSQSLFRITLVFSLSAILETKPSGSVQF